MRISLLDQQSNIFEQQTGHFLLLFGMSQHNFLHKFKSGISNVIFLMRYIFDFVVEFYMHFPFSQVVRFMMGYLTQKHKLKFQFFYIVMSAGGISFFNDLIYFLVVVAFEPI